MQLTHSNVAREDIRDLIEQASAPCVSLFLAAHRPGETQQRMVQLENLLRRAESELAADGYELQWIGALLAPARELMDPLLLERYQAHSLAIYVAPGMFRLFELPQPLEEQAFVGRQPTIKPLLMPTTAVESFYVLALSKNQVRLIHATPHGVESVALPNAPQSLDNALQIDTLGRQARRHISPSTHGGASGAMYPGYGNGNVDEKGQIQQYLQQVEAAVALALQRAYEPLALAGVEYLLAIYRSLNSYANMSAASIGGNPDHLSNEALCVQAAAALAPLSAFDAAREAELYFKSAAHTPSRASSNLRAILPAAHAGRVARLLIAGDRQAPGRYDPATETVSVHDEALPGDEDLLDTAARQTLLHGGEVLALPADVIPGGGIAAALLRY